MTCKRAATTPTQIPPSIDRRRESMDRMASTCRNGSSEKRPSNSLYRKVTTRMFMLLPVGGVIPRAQTPSPLVPGSSDDRAPPDCLTAGPSGRVQLAVLDATPNSAHAVGVAVKVKRPKRRPRVAATPEPPCPKCSSFVHYFACSPAHHRPLRLPLRHEGRVGQGDCSPGPPTEPDLWPTHPALWVGISWSKCLNRGLRQPTRVDRQGDETAREHAVRYTRQVRFSRGCVRGAGVFAPSRAVGKRELH